MSISIHCPDCDKKLKAKDELAGKRVKCPGCGRLLAVPTAAPIAAGHPPTRSPKRSHFARVPDDDAAGPVPPPASRARWLLFVAGAAGLCVVAVLVVVFAVPRGGNPSKEPVAKGDKNAPGDNGGNKKDDAAASEEPKGVSLGTFGPWQVQLLRFEFAQFTANQKIGPTLTGNDYDLVGNSPTQNLFIHVKATCIEDTSFKDNLSPIPTFHISGQSEALSLQAKAGGTITPKGQKDLSQGKLVGLPAIANVPGLLGSSGKKGWKKGEQNHLLAVVSLANHDMTAISKTGVKLQIRRFQQDIAGVDLPLAIPGKLDLVPPKTDQSKTDPPKTASPVVDATPAAKEYDEQLSPLLKKLWSAQGKEAVADKMNETLTRACSGVKKQGGALVTFHLAGKPPTVWGGGKRDPDRPLTAVLGKDLTSPLFEKPLTEKLVLESLGKPEKQFAGGNLTVFVGGVPQGSGKTPDHLCYLDGILVFLCKDAQVQDVAIDIARLGLGISSMEKNVELAPGRYQLDWMGEGALMMYRGRDDEVEILKKGDSYFLKIAGDKYYGGVTSEVKTRGPFVEFTGRFCTDSDVRFLGRIQGKNISGTFSGTVSFNGESRRFDWGTFAVSPK